MKLDKSTNDLIKVSVCVVTYNQEKYIEECLSSIVTQKTTFRFNIIVADDGSTDQTRDIINRYALNYPGIIVPVFRKNNLGAFKNFVTTHNMAKGSYICHCDGDDRWLPGKLQAQANFLDDNLGFTVVWSRMNLFTDKGIFFPGEQYDYSMFKDGVVTFSHALRLGSVAVHSSIMYRLSVRETRLPEFDAIDLFYTWEFLSKGPGKILDQVLGEYRVAVSDSLTNNLCSKLKRLYILHAIYYLQKYPEQKKNIFIFSLWNLLVDLKNKRATWKNCFKLAFRSISYVSPFEFFRHVKEVRKLSLPRIFRR